MRTIIDNEDLATIQDALQYSIASMQRSRANYIHYRKPSDKQLAAWDARIAKFQVLYNGIKHQYSIDVEVAE